MEGWGREQRPSSAHGEESQEAEGGGGASLGQLRIRAARHKRSIMRKAERAAAAAGEVRIPDAGGQGLAAPVRQRMESQLGSDLSSVRVHTGVESQQAASALGARAFTDGHDVHFNAGQFSPGTKDGDRLLAHELTHVVQGQRSGLQRKASGAPATATNVRVSDPGDAAEVEADAVGNHVAGQLHERASAQAPQIAARISGIGRQIFRNLHGSQPTAAPAPSGGATAAPSGGGAAPPAPSGNVGPAPAPGGGDAEHHDGGGAEHHDGPAPAPSGGGGAVDPLLGNFARRFNATFRAQLHVFGTTAEPAAERGPATRDPTATSGDGVPPERLRELFTDTQRRLLGGFCETGVIPNRLFDGDDVGTATAQQRIELSGHILATGTYTPGSRSQRLYARMCGHWVNLVYSYAGCGQAHGAGITEQFDHDGGLSMSTGDREHPVDASTGMGQRMDHFDSPSEAPVHSRGEMRGLPYGSFGTIQTGDWLWIFNDNGGAYGNHSVVFSRWASDWLTAPPDPQRPGGPPNRYRRAICMSQQSPREGGHEHTELLGERFGVDAEGHRITTITNVSRAPADAHPIHTVDELRAALGSSPAEAEQNAQYIDRMQHQHHGQVDLPALRADLVARNTALLSQLDAHLTDGQRRIFAQTNSGEDLAMLIRLNERLGVLAHNGQVLDESDEHQEQRLEAARTRPRDPRAAAEADRVDAQLAELDADEDQLLQTQQTEQAAADASDGTAALRDATHAAHEALVARNALNRQRRATHDPAARQPIEAQLVAANARVQTTLAALDAARTEQRESRDEHRGHVQAARHATGQIARDEARRRPLEHRRLQLIAESGIHVAQLTSRDDRAAFTGAGEPRRLTGLLRNLDPQPSWSTIIRPAPGGGT